MTTDIWTPSSIYDLSDDDIKAFQELVIKDTKNQYLTSEEKTILANNLDLWLFCLRNLRKELELKLSHRKINIRADISHMRNNGASEDEINNYYVEAHKARNATIKFLTAIERKTLYVKLLLDEDKD